MLQETPSLAIITSCTSGKTKLVDPQDGELTPDSMSSRIDSPRASKMPFEMGRPITSAV
jgi:hypothetical protein